MFEALKEMTKQFMAFKDMKDDFIIIDDSKNQFLEIKEYISNLIDNEIGNQDFKNIKQIYIFNSNILNTQPFLGASYSFNFKKTKQCIAIFKVIDLL